MTTKSSNWLIGFRLTYVGISATYFAVCLASALNHVMWRDEWQPIVAARDTSSYTGFLQTCQWYGMDGFFSFVWLIQQCGLDLWFFKIVLVTISTVGIFVFCRYAPFTGVQKLLFALGYFPLYEYGVILRNYGIILTASIVCTAAISSASLRPLFFFLGLAAMAQTNAFGGVFCVVFAGAYLFELYRRNALTRAFLLKPATAIGVGVAAVSFGIAAFALIKTAFFAPEYIAAAGSGGNVRNDPYIYRFIESLAFPIRGLLPIPLFGSWNTHILDPWSWLQILGSVAAITFTFAAVARSRTAVVFLALGFLGLAALFSHVPWTSMRYHGHYLVLFVLAMWMAIALSGKSTRETGPGASWASTRTSTLFTTLLAVHAAIGFAFVVQERVVPFSGSREAAEIIRRNAPPDAVVIGDIDAWMLPVSGYLGRPIYIASRKRMGSYVTIDKERRWMPLKPEEWSAIISEQFSKQKGDLILVTNYPMSVPPELGTTIAVVDRSITDERYFIFRLTKPNR